MGSFVLCNLKLIPYGKQSFDFSSSIMQLSGHANFITDSNRL